MANNSYPKEKKKKTPNEHNFATQKIWDSIAKNYDMINGAQAIKQFYNTYGLKRF